ncbi:phosphatidylinositol phosphatidylcholine transfer SFH11 isoform X3 [Micractinium conductrix]|uniref:Phosphatidylinositol phosphatidylcholine transfer SFH11 isoform X3 n=1 Tax=Micractinium conductrix TaxID=554055 RepID=A0A2P6UZL6_9CHLO|nr:phosphatidylinositol phosphatidylcholine transfer SFH11 isoform X3 [Micractinium conductrix]|eukprot:PSC67286.1 phosphatidylinositol phosphatidylcholine transfer SFH11 isoform X3 [Micractinium conductrix]
MEDGDCAKWGVSSEQEWQLVQQLTDEIELEAGPLAAEWDKYVMRRFLRARKMNILAAKQMFLEQLEWRKGVQVDTVLTDFHFDERPAFSQFYPEGFYGTDREGRPVYVQQPGKIDLDQLWKVTTQERCIRYHLQQQERYWRIIAPSCSVTDPRGRKHEQSLVLIDMEGVGVSTMTGEVRRLMGLIMQIDQDYFPELMWKAVIVNAPMSFRAIWALIKHFMDACTQAKIEVLGTNFKEELLRLVSPDQLMACYGGSNPAPLSAEPGPWQDPAVLAALEQQRQQRLAECKRPSSMTFPPVPGGARAAAVAGGGDAAPAVVEGAAAHGGDEVAGAPVAAALT